MRKYCHLTGKYRGAVHNHCNLQSKVPKYVQIVFHNLSYIYHSIRGSLLNKRILHVSLLNKRIYISFTKFIPVSQADFFQLRFVDSLTETQYKLLTRKGIYPYGYFNKCQRYKERSLPPINNFYSFRTNENISFRSEFHIQNLEKYTVLYLKTDVFENFRKTCKRHYYLDPAFYFTPPCLSFNAMLCKTGVKLELISDLAIVRMIQSGVRVGVCLCSHRHADANNKYVAAYNPDHPDKFIVYIDSNNLYGFSVFNLRLLNFQNLI